MARIIIIHGWGGGPEECWLPWLKQELEKKGHQVELPEMPDNEEPTIEAWVGHLQSLSPDEHTYLIGHSIGCQTILRYIQDNKAKGCLFVAGWVHLLPAIYEEGDDVVEIAKPWLDTTIGWEKAKENAEAFIALFSDNDPYVPLEDAQIFLEKLGARVIIEPGKGHYLMEQDDTILREAETLLKL